MIDDSLIYYFVFQKKTAFIPLKSLYPECFFLRKDHPRTEALQCFKTSCPANKNCADIVAKRVFHLFEHVVVDSELLLAYFKNTKGSICAGVFQF